MPQICDYEIKYKLALQENKARIQQEINSPATLLKIKNWAEKFGYEIEVVKQKILTDEMFATFFIKDPAKQNIYEKTAVDYLTPYFQGGAFRKVSPAGTNALFLDEEGRITIERSIECTKSIDFQGFKNNKFYYITHKYTKESGGAQDNQLNDVKHFLSNAMKSDNSLGYLVAILDGPYYKNKFEELRRVYNKENILIVTIEEFATYIENNG